MNPPLWFLVVDDNTARADRLQKAAEIAFGARAARIERVADLNKLFLDYWRQPEELASVDAIFVDFDLVADKHPDFDEREEIALTSVTGEPRTFRPTTGMSALLRIRELQESAAYKSAWGRKRKHEWLDNKPCRLYSFVQMRAIPSRFFAAAAQSWFGATYLDPSLSETNLATALADPVTHAKRDVPVAVRAASVQLAVMLEQDPLGETQLLAREQRPSGYDWYCIYLAMRGKSGFGFEGLAAAIYDVTGQGISAKQIEPVQFVPIASKLQVQLQGFLACFLHAPEGAWPTWGLRFQRADPMLDALRSSELFWTAPDVQVAYQEHVARTARPGHDV